MKNNQLQSDQLLKDHLSQLGKKGGKTTKKNHGLNYYKNIGKLGAEKRWGKKISPSLDSK